MDLVEKIEIDIKAREKATEIINKFGLVGLSYYKDVLNTVISTGIEDAECKLKELKA